MPATTDATPPLPGLPPVAGKSIITRVEASAQGTDTRVVVANLAAGSAAPSTRLSPAGVTF